MHRVYLLFLLAFVTFGAGAEGKMLRMDIGSRIHKVDAFPASPKLNEVL
jgi:hypothetical protein